jgi:hypothetical protein
MPIRAGRSRARSFGDRLVVGTAVHRPGRGKHHTAGASGPLRRLGQGPQQAGRATDVGVEVAGRVSKRFADPGQPGQVADPLGLILKGDLAEPLAVQQVRLEHHHAVGWARAVLAQAAGEHGHLVTGLGQLQGHDAADVAEPSGHKYSHLCRPPYALRIRS